MHSNAASLGRGVRSFLRSSALDDFRWKRPGRTAGADVVAGTYSVAVIFLEFAQRTNGNVAHFPMIVRVLQNGAPCDGRTDQRVTAARHQAARRRFPRLRRRSWYISRCTLRLYGLA